MQRTSLALLLLALGLSASVPGAAQTPAIQIEPVDCIPNNANAVVRASVRPEIGGAEVRLYFRWDEHGPFYYVAMAATGGGAYWATPPKPIDENHQVEMYVAVVDPTGEVVGYPSERGLVPVTNDCDVLLSDRERGMAENLVVGETEADQMDEMVLGFLCDGIISRIGHDGVLRADSICRRCIVAWWDKPEALLPAALLLGKKSNTPSDPVEASPSRP